MLLLGPTGSGKTPLGEQLQQCGWQGCRCHHFDFGRHLRETAAATEPYRNLSRDDVAIVRYCLRTGALLENETFEIARKILTAFATSRMTTPGDRLVLNGLPRHVGQARMLADSVSVDTVILLECDAATVYERIRRNIGGERNERTDDTRQAVCNRLNTYHRRTLPLADFYRDAGATIIRLPVDASTATDTLVRQLTVTT